MPLARAGSPGVAASAVAATLALAALAWIFAVRQMAGMDMGVATELGSFASFSGVWVAMMAAMMLPGASRAVVRYARSGQELRDVPLFLLSYLAVWALVGVVVYSLYRPHGTTAAGVAVIVAGGYELTPFKRRARERCRAGVRSGFAFGTWCVGSSINLMAMLVVLGPMCLTWMGVLTAVVVAQKLLPPKAAVDDAIALAIVGFGVLILAAPASVPGLVPVM
jgi:predicted metal-binding membrane protein